MRLHHRHTAQSKCGASHWSCGSSSATAAAATAGGGAARGDSRGHTQGVAVWGGWQAGPQDLGQSLFGLLSALAVRSRVQRPDLFLGHDLVPEEQQQVLPDKEARAKTYSQVACGETEAVG